MVFSVERLPEVQSFDSGREKIWEIGAADWIKGPPTMADDCALADMRNFGTEVWLYKLDTPDGDVVGFGSLGTSNWLIPPDPNRRAISLIPWVALQRKFWGKSDENGKFSDQILDDLKFEALSHPDREPILGLYVHPENTYAVEFYKRANFEFVPGRVCKVGGIKYPAMMLEL